MDRPRKTRDEIIGELLAPHRIPPEVLAAANKGLETWRNRSIWNRTTPDFGGNARDLDISVSNVLIPFDVMISR